MKNKIKFCLLTGFLGAGKTTLLKNLINALIKDNIRAGIIVNEFGKVSIDGIFLSEVHTDVVELNNGVITSYSIHYTKLYDLYNLAISIHLNDSAAGDSA